MHYPLVRSFSLFRGCGLPFTHRYHSNFAQNRGIKLRARKDNFAQNSIGKAKSLTKEQPISQMTRIFFLETLRLWTFASIFSGCSTMKAEVQLFYAQIKESGSNFAINSSLSVDISSWERLGFIDIIHTFRCMGWQSTTANKRLYGKDSSIVAFVSVCVLMLSNYFIRSN